MIHGLYLVKHIFRPPFCGLTECKDLASFEVYVRRAYKAYSLLALDYEEGDGLDDGDAPHVVTWRFNLGQSHSPPATPQISNAE